MMLFGKKHGLYIPSTEDKEVTNRLTKRANHLGILVEIYSDGLPYTKDEEEALKYLRRDKDVPKELEERLLKTKEDRLAHFYKSC